MMRLVRRGLMYGNLFAVNSPSMVQRYNRALKHLTGKTTALSEFSIDISGFSPEVGHELEDPLYLNPKGCNRQFILLSIEQSQAPLLNAHFSTSRAILREYIESNEEQLFALTMRDAVAGELANSVYVVDNPQSLFQLSNIIVEADTLGGHVAASKTLEKKILHFMDDPNAWWDDVLIAEMVELSKQTGDIIGNPIRLDPQSFQQTSFYTQHFDGVYVFQELARSACIFTRSQSQRGRLPVDIECTMADRHDIAAFLHLNNLVEPLTERRIPNAGSILKQKLDFMVIDVAAHHGEDLSTMSRRDLRNLPSKYHSRLPAEYHALREAAVHLQNQRQSMRIAAENPAYFYLLRSRPHQHKYLVNMLLAELTPLDFRQLFICHKGAFYAAYRDWSEAKKSYVAQFLTDEYMLDKAGTRAELFGPEPGMEEDEPDFGFGRGMGPWGEMHYE